MSSTAVENLEIARNIRARGYPTSIHTNPTFKKWFDAEYSKGSSVYSLYRQACEKWGKENVPSPPTLYNYVEKFLPFDKLLPFIPNYKEQIRSFDAYQELIELCKVMKERLNTHYEHEKKLGILIAEITKSFDIYAKTLNKLIEVEMKLGIRGFAKRPTFYGAELNTDPPQQATATQQADEADLDDDSPVTLEELIAYRDELKAYAKETGQDLSHIIGE